MSLRLVEIIMGCSFSKVEGEADDLWRKSPALLGRKSHNQLLSISSLARRAVTIGLHPKAGYQQTAATKEHVNVWALKKSGQQVKEVLVYVGL